MAKTYKIGEICGDWALQVKEPVGPHKFLYFKSKNNAELVKSILEWEDAHPNEAVPYKPTLTPPNEPLTMEQLREMEDPVWCVCKTVEGFEGFWCLCNHGYILTPARQIFDVKEIPHWVFYRCPPEGEDGDADRG